MKQVLVFLALCFLCSCAQETQPGNKDYEDAVLAHPNFSEVAFYSDGIEREGLFLPEKGDYGYAFYSSFDENIKSGFAGPFSSNISIKQFISFDILNDEQWIIGNQLSYPGRIVQHSQKGDFNIEQTLFFSDNRTSISRYVIENNSDYTQGLEMEWTVNISDEMVFEKDRKYGVRFTIENAEIWPHSSGITPFDFSADSTKMKKQMIIEKLLPKELAYVYSITAFVVDQDSIQPLLRCRPWLLFPEEEYWENCAEYGKALLKEQ